MARLRGAASPLPGMLGQAGTRWALNHGRLWGRAGSPPQRGRGGHASGPVSMHPPEPQNRLLPATLFYFHLSTYHHVNDLVRVFPYLDACPPPSNVSLL